MCGIAGLIDWRAASSADALRSIGEAMIETVRHRGPDAGEVWVELDKVRLTATPGRCVIIPPHTPHAWGAVGPGAARVMFIWPVLEPFAPGKSTYLEGAPPAVS